MIDKYINYLVENSSPEKPLWNQEMIRQGKKPHWNYIDGCMMTAFLQLYKKTNDNKYLNFVKNFIDYFVEDNGNVKTFNIEEYNLDNINEGRSLFDLYDLTGEEKYKLALDNIYKQILEQPRTKEGNFWHKAIYPNQVWLDGLYMAQPFYLEYDRRFNNKANYKDILSQIRTVNNLIKDSNTGLFYHAYDSSRESFWCNKETGLSPNFWLRALGWFLMALVDILEILADEECELKQEVNKIFIDLVNSLLKFQDESGMWYQVVDKKDYPNNYLETSGSSIIAYGILKAVKLNILPLNYKEYGLKAYNGICNKYLKIQGETIHLGGICLVAGLGGKDKRDGSVDYYLSEPIVEDEAKGIAPFLLAYLYLN
jgi:unsaturated rhamnogalacturonyl hydrolase